MNRLAALFFLFTVSVWGQFFYKPWEYQNCYQFHEPTGFKMHWNLSGDTIYFGLEAQAPNGYISIGFSKDGSMLGQGLGADAYVVSRNDIAGDPCNRDNSLGGCVGDIWMTNYGQAPWDDSQDAVVEGVGSTSTYLTASFSRKINTGDPKDWVINTTNAYVLYAMHATKPASKGNTPIHSLFSVVAISFSSPYTCDAPAPPATGSASSTSTSGIVTGNYYTATGSTSTNRYFTSTSGKVSTSGSSPSPNGKTPIEQTQKIDPKAFRNLIAPGFLLYWEFDVNEVAHFKMIVNATGWISICFHADGKPTMANCDCVVAWVDDTTQKATLLDQWSKNYQMPVSDPGLDGGSNDYALSNASQIGGNTYITFRRYLKTGDPWDIDIMDGGQTIVWGYAPDDGIEGSDPSGTEAFYPIHTKYGAVSLDFASGKSTVVKETPWSPGLVLVLILIALLLIYMLFRGIFKCLGCLRNKRADRRAGIYEKPASGKSEPVQRGGYDEEDNSFLARANKYKSIPVPMSVYQGSSKSTKGGYDDSGYSNYDQGTGFRREGRVLRPGQSVQQPKRGGGGGGKKPPMTDIELSNGTNFQPSKAPSNKAEMQQSLGEQSNRVGLVNFVVGIFSWRIFGTDLSIGHLIILLIYVGVNIAIIYLYTDKMKALGSLVAGNGLIVCLPATRNSVLVLITGVPFDKTIMYHRWIGIFTIGLTIAHSVYAIVIWKQSDMAIGTQLGIAKYYFGAIGTVVAILMFIFSLPVFRRKTFEVFFYTHFLFIAFFVMGCLHSPKFIPFAAVTLAVYVVDRIIRIVWGVAPMRTISLTIKSSKDVVQIRFPRHVLARKLGMYKPGQYVFLNFPTVNFLEWHPFTLSSGPDEQSCEVFIKALGDHTKFLLEKAKGSKQLWIRVDGPYGNLNINYRRFPVVLLVSGGIGFTPVLAMARDIYRTGDLLDYQKRNPPKHCIEHVYIVWTIQTFSQFSWFKEDLEEIVRSANDPAKPRLHLIIYLSQMTEEATKESIGFHQGRPEFEGLFDKILLDHPKKATSVFVCGPSIMVNTIWDLTIQKALRGNRFDFHSETFEF